MPDFLVVGHLAQDLVPGGYRVGGTTTYAAVTAQRLGRAAAILTRAAPALELPPQCDGIEVHRLPSPVNTTFENIYHDAVRVQYLHARAETLYAAELPPALRAVPLALLGPIAREVETAFVHAFAPETAVTVVPQGWMRQWDARGLVRPRPWEEAEAILPHVRTLVLSEQDLLGFEDQLESYVRLAPLTVVTRGPLGARVYPRGGAPFDSPGFPANEVDPTGAGDVFAAAFMIRLSETDDVVEAARFANCTASFSVEAPGILGIPTRAQVEKRMADSRFQASP